MLPPKPPPKPGSLGDNENIDTNSFSFSAAKALFDVAKKPEAQKMAVAAAKNPYVRQTAKNIAQDEKARGAVLNAVKDPSGGNKISAAFAVADANRKADVPPPPPHRDSGSSYTKPAPGKLSSSHFAIRSQLENLHLGGSTSSSTSFTTSSVSPTTRPTYNNGSSSTPYVTTYQSSSAPPPPVPCHTASTAPSYSTPAISTPHGIALFDYKPAQSDEMALRVGDTVLMSKTVDPLWVYGENQDTRTYGIVPISYLDIKIPLKQAFHATAPLSTAPKSSGTGLYATALYPYSSTEPSDLSFSAGDRIEIISRLNIDWLEGELRGQKGMFPAQYVDCPDLSRVPTKESQLPYNDFPNNIVPVKTVEVKFNYDSGVETDLRVFEGDIVQVIDDLDADWLYGECRGRQGMVPKSFLGAPYGSPSKKKSMGIAEIANAFSPKRAVATANFHTQDPNNLYATRGDRLLIVEDVDEYYFKAKPEMFKTIAAGNIPKNMVEFTN